MFVKGYTVKTIDLPVNDKACQRQLRHDKVQKKYDMRQNTRQDGVFLLILVKFYFFKTSDNLTESNCDTPSSPIVTP